MVVYPNMYYLKKQILNDNKGKPGIYMLSNKVTKDFYIGQSKNLYNRFLNYFNTGYLKRSKSIISRALIKHGYLNFSLTILEYCAKVDLTVREQYYFDNLNPVYNIEKIAGSSLGLIRSEETKAKISKALKGLLKGENSY